MKSTFKIAWRSLWRNRRRTLLTSASVLLSISLALFMRSMQFGSYEQMIQAGVNQVGDLQIHDNGYWENKSLDRAFFEPQDMNKTLKSIPGVKNVLPGLETFSLASYGKQTKGILVSGIDPVKQNKQTKLSRKIIAGKYLHNPGDVIIGDQMAKFLKVNVGDSIVLLGQGFRGLTAYGIYKVSGIFHLPSLQMNSQLLYMSLTDAQNFVYPYQAGLLTDVSVFLTDQSELGTVKKEVKEKMGKKFEVLPWQTMLTDILQTIKVDNVGGQFMLMILYVIAAFGIFSTILMMTMEKRKQYAVMISVGMQRRRLIAVSVMETFIVAIMGIIVGLIIISPILYYLHYNPIPMTGSMADMYLEFNIDPVLPFSIRPHIFLSQTAIVMVLSLLSALYPIIYLSKFNVLKAFRH